MYDVPIDAFAVSQDMTLDLALPLKRVTVHVQDATNAAVPNATLMTSCPPALRVSLGTSITGFANCFYNSAVTNGSGDATLWLFSATAATVGYTFTATPPAGSIYIATTKSAVEVTADTTVTITLVRPFVISGRVVDGLGNGLPGQTVKVQDGNSSATTDATGHYSVQVTPGSHALLLSGDNSSLTLNIPQMYNVPIDAFTVSQDMTLDLALPLKQVSVHVQDANGVSVPNTTITTSCPPALHISLGANITGFANCLYNTVATNGTGDVTLWLFPATTATVGYTFTATPPAGSDHPVTSLAGVTLATDTSLTIVLQVDVVTGSSTGGIPATFAGTGFQSGTKVFFDGLAATSVTITGSTATSANARTPTSSAVSTLIAVPPAHGPGKVDVMIVNPNGQSITIHGGYNFISVAAAPPARSTSGDPSPVPVPPVPSGRTPAGSGGGTPPSVVPIHR